jgi:predicted amidohydrolase
MGAEVICRPSMLTRSFEIWELTNRARAYDNHVYMVSCNGVGPDAGGNYYFGHSMIVDPIACKLAQARGTEEVVFAELNPDPIKFMTYGTKSPMIFDHLADRNLAAYGNILTPARSRFEPGKRGT